MYEIGLKSVARILDRLRDAGWGDELDKNSQFDLTPLTTHTSMKKPRELTDRSWKSIKPNLIRIMEEIRYLRLMVENPAS